MSDALAFKLFAGALLLAATAPVAPSLAQDFPSRPITWVVPYPAGGNPDVMARFVARGVSEKLGQPVLIDNKTGAAGIVGTEFALASKPDGYTILYASSSMMTVIPVINTKLTFSPQRDFAPVHGLGSYDMVLVTNASKPQKDVKSFVDYAKANPKKLNYGSAGVGTTAHMASAYFQTLNNIEMTHIPFRGAGQSVPALLSNDIDFLFDYPSTTKTLIEGGKLNALVVTGPTRMASLPNVPTLQESGYPNASFSTWDIILAPAATPKDVRDKLAAAFEDVLSRPETAKFFEERGAKPQAGFQGKKLDDFIAAESTKMKEIADKVGVKAE